MRSLFVLTYCLIIGFSSASTPAQDFEKYFELKAEKYKEAEGEYVGVSPAIKDNASDNVGRFITSHPRRFRYLLANNSKFQGLDSLYPDVVKMNKLYIDSIRADKKFVLVFQNLPVPVTSKTFKRETYRKKELMQVASRFFFCDTVRPDKSIGSHIYIALNGLKEAQFEKDYTVLEAFCFEAIFEAIDQKRPVRTKFVENFLAYIEEISNKEKQNISSSDSYLRNVRLAVFGRLQTDKELENVLLEYFQKNKENLSFNILD